MGPSWVPQRYFQFRSFRLFILSDAIHQILGIRELKPNSSQPKGSPPRLNTCATGIRVWMFSLLTFGHLRIPQMCQQKLLGSGWRNRQTSRNDLYNTLPFVPNFLDLFGKSSIPLIAIWWIPYDLRNCGSINTCLALLLQVAARDFGDFTEKHLGH